MGTQRVPNVTPEVRGLFSGRGEGEEPSSVDISRGGFDIGFLQKLGDSAKSELRKHSAVFALKYGGGIGVTSVAAGASLKKKSAGGVGIVVGVGAVANNFGGAEEGSGKHWKQTAATLLGGEITWTVVGVALLFASMCGLVMVLKNASDVAAEDKRSVSKQIQLSDLSVTLSTFVVPILLPSGFELVTAILIVKLDLARLHLENTIGCLIPNTDFCPTCSKSQNYSTLLSLQVLA
jgi:hypothetical protein